jgi:WD40 repeat protein
LFIFGVVALAVFFLASNAHSAPGDLYVAEATSGTIFKFTPDGTKTTFASGIHEPLALAFDRKGNLFVANSGAGVPQMPSSILKFTPDGTESTFATNDSSAILGLAFDGVGNLFATTGFILKFAPDGTVTGFAPSVRNAWPLTFDPLGNLFAGNNPTGPSSILKITPDEGITTFTSFSGPSSSTTAMAFDGGGNLFARVGGDILKVDSTGSNTVFASGSFESALAFDESGNLFAVLDAFDSTQPAIVKFAPDGTQTTFAFGSGQSVSRPDPRASQRHRCARRLQ